MKYFSGNEIEVEKVGRVCGMNGENCIHNFEGET